jgi:hypothetical protein
MLPYHAADLALQLNHFLNQSCLVHARLVGSRKTLLNLYLTVNQWLIVYPDLTIFVKATGGTAGQRASVFQPSGEKD